MKKIFYAMFLVLLVGSMAGAATINVDAAAARDFPKICESGTPEQVAEAIGKIGGDVNSVTVDDGISMLMMAAANNPNPKVVELLIGAGANLKATTTTHGHTVLIMAAMHNSPEIVNILLKAGCNVNEINKIGNTPLMIALRDNPNLNVARTLIAAGADVNAKNHNQWSAIMTVAEGKIKGGAVQALDILLKDGADINANYKDGLTPLMILANLNPDIPLLIAFLQAGANAKATDNSGKTALDYVKNEYVGTDGYKILEAAVNGEINISSSSAGTPPVVAPPVPIQPNLPPPVITPPAPPAPPTPPAPPVIKPPVVVPPPPPPAPKTFSLEGTWVTIFDNQYMYMRCQGNQYQVWMNGANVLSENGYFQLQNNVISGVNQITGNNFALNVQFSADGMYVQLTDANGNGFQYQRVQ